MKNPLFHSGQVVKIENKEQFNEIYHLLRSAQSGVPLEEWINEIAGGYPEFPIYLEHFNSVFHSSIGFIFNPVNSYTNQPYEVLSIEEACK